MNLQSNHWIYKGWLPVDAVVVDGRPGLWWMEMSDVSLTEPFFQQTVERAKTRAIARELFTEFDVLLQLEKQLDSVAAHRLHLSLVALRLDARRQRLSRNRQLDRPLRSKRDRQTNRTGSSLTLTTPSKSRSIQSSCAAWSTRWPNVAPATNNISSSSLPVAASRRSNASDASGPTCRGFFFTEIRSKRSSRMSETCRRGSMDNDRRVLASIIGASPPKSRR